MNPKEHFERGIEAAQAGKKEARAYLTEAVETDEGHLETWL
jgi:hypothetical protein